MEGSVSICNYSGGFLLAKGAVRRAPKGRVFKIGIKNLRIFCQWFHVF